MNKLIIASAGSGKTTFIVNDAIEKARQGTRVLITTFTVACEQEIRDKIVSICGCIPEPISIITWFSFLLNHGVKPFQGRLFEFDTRGMILVNGKSGFRFKNRRGQPIYWGEDDFTRYFFTSDQKVYSDKLALLALRCNEKSEGRVFDRIARCFNHIYIDEVQDLAGYDLEVLEELFQSKADITLVGDPRQATYSTVNTRKNKKYAKANIVNFFEDTSLNIEKDDESLVVNHRCHSAICDFSNRLYPDWVPAQPSEDEASGHDGLFALDEKEVDHYLEYYKPIQLRDSAKKRINEDYPVLTFGKSKGLTYPRVLIYPSGPMIKWLKNQNEDLTQAARSKFYVALTRAKHSVAIVLKASDIKKIPDLAEYK
ncbi:UvrD-helicase domain-containing protein [Aestuariicella sp. G3-2]|uniref:UvrD-helicase domain-containing protein n=1 Tax=Pseudomaricurvus albidus TaxID=2842452 RepID=UPI001C0D5DBE|nr:UvrD-helicase domain-containing protein [Aestuariicella albida]MBU3070211.1 UvrD-helicase domain-containing protein [Aestuariicella albida]